MKIHSLLVNRKKFVNIQLSKTKPTDVFAAIYMCTLSGRLTTNFMCHLSTRDQ